MLAVSQLDYWKILKIINFHDFLIKIIFLGSCLGSAGSGMSRNVFLSYFLPVVHAAGVFFFFWKNYIFDNFGRVIFSKNDFLVVFSLPCMPQVLFLKKIHFWEFWTCHFLKKILFSGFLSVLHAAGAFLSEKLHISIILDMPNSPKVCFLSKTRLLAS